MTRHISSARTAFRRAARRALLASGVEVTRVGRAPGGEVMYSSAERVIAKHLRRLEPRERYCVDIAAADGKNGSNTYRLFLDGWGGLAVECNELMFARLGVNYMRTPRVRLHRGLVTPANVVALLEAAGAPKQFGFLSLDIDGYDYDVLRALLQEYRPTLICAEINEKIPPPIKFAVRYSEQFQPGQGHFYGQSICTLDALRAESDYVLLGLEYINAFLAPAESGLEGVPADVAYRQGYLERTDRLELMPWNREFEDLHAMTPQDGVDAINARFARCRGAYDISS
jgi:hypothetical protein